MFLEHASTLSPPPPRIHQLLCPVAILLAALSLHLWSPVRIFAAAPGMYYVDSLSGNDSNLGTSPLVAWKTLASLHSRTFQPGDTIHFRRGASWDGGLTITSSGASGVPITYTTYGSDADPRPVFTNSGEWSSAITIDASWIVLEGVLVRGAHENGVRIERHANHNIVRNIEATQVGIGVAVHGEHNLVTQSLFHDLTMVVDTNDGGYDDWGALGICIYDSHNEVSYNTMRGCSAHSFDFEADGGAVEIYALYGEIEGTRIRNNWSCSNAGFLEIGGTAGSGVRDTIVSYNVTRNSGMFLCTHLDGAFGSGVSDLRVENNTVVEEGEAWTVLAFVGGVPTNDTLTLRNNVFDVADFTLFTNQDGFLHTNNLYNLRNQTTALGLVLSPAAGERLGDPLFIDTIAQDYRVQPGSPAINGGTALGYAQDYVGTPVPNGVYPDMGAYEYASERMVASARVYLPIVIR